MNPPSRLQFNKRHFWEPRRKYNRGEIEMIATSHISNGLVLHIMWSECNRNISSAEWMCTSFYHVEKIKKNIKLCISYFNEETKRVKKRENMLFLVIFIFFVINYCHKAQQ